MPETSAEPQGPERAVLRSALRDGGLLVAGLVVVGGLVGLATAGLPGLLGALAGGVVVAFFCGTTVWSMWASVGKPPATMAGYVMGSWLAKMAVLFLALLALRGVIDGMPAAARFVVLGVVALGAVGSALLDYRAVRNGRVPYVDG
ncbi:hypothetical protein [Myceligenerans indicum]|uniref:ATP synthase protein I n=1 Tax=Myceligenerans indicum TaxID=2593663 RepID=A0ABS1LJS7_9MICO|nr:hypothetical protein [Myceligenerans indicum]MBL0885827.1 hypothetical protein [Myceligenerans indicum]